VGENDTLPEPLVKIMGNEERTHSLIIKKGGKSIRLCRRDVGGEKDKNLYLKIKKSIIKRYIKRGGNGNSLGSIEYPSLQFREESKKSWRTFSSGKKVSFPLCKVRIVLPNLSNKLLRKKLTLVERGVPCKKVLDVSSGDIVGFFHFSFLGEEGGGDSICERCREADSKRGELG